METWGQLALEGFKVEFLEIDSAAGDKLFFVGAFAVGVKSGLVQAVELARLSFALGKCPQARLESFKIKSHQVAQAFLRNAIGGFFEICFLAESWRMALKAASRSASEYSGQKLTSTVYL